MKFAKFTTIDDKEFYVNPTYVVVIMPQEETTVIVAHYGQFRVKHPLEEVVSCFEGFVQFTNFSNDKEFYINPTYVAEIVSNSEDNTTIISHQGEFTVGMSIDETSAYLNEGLEKLS